MGSSGSDRISDYPGSSSPGGSRGPGGTGSSGSNESPQDRCSRAFDANLEDVEQSEYYQSHGKVQPVGTRLVIVQLKRLVARTAEGIGAGNLPTSFNYLASCMKDGWTYIGEVRRATSGPPIARISADFAPTPSK